LQATHDQSDKREYSKGIGANQKFANTTTQTTISKESSHKPLSKNLTTLNQALMLIMLKYLTNSGDEFSILKANFISCLLFQKTLLEYLECILIVN
jgi:hypothetical protein